MLYAFVKINTPILISPLFVKLFFAFFAIFFNTRYNALTARDTELANLTFQDAELAL